MNVAISSSGVKDNNGNIIGTAAILRDVTGHMQAVEALRISAERLAQAQRIGKLGYLDWDLATNELVLCEETIRIYGLDKEKKTYRSQDIVNLLHPDDRERVEKSLQAAIAGVAKHDLEHRMICPDGTEVFVRATAELILDRNGKPVRLLGTNLDITERKRAEQELQDYAKRLQGLSRRLVATEETERRKISRELHDRVGQNLGALNIQLNILRSQLSQESLREVSAPLEKTQMLLAETAAHARNVMADLRPPALDEYGLLAALCSYVDSFGAHVVIPITVRGEDLAPRLPPAAEMALFRIAQGAIANAIQHARAKRIEVVLVAAPEWVTLTIADDGAGFDPEHVLTTRPSWGLTIMRERAEAVGAQLRVESTPGDGTQVCVEIDRKTGSKPAMNADEHE